MEQKQKAVNSIITTCDRVVAEEVQKLLTLLHSKGVYGVGPEVWERLYRATYERNEAIRKELSAPVEVAEPVAKAPEMYEVVGYVASKEQFNAAYCSHKNNEFECEAAPDGTKLTKRELLGTRSCDSSHGETTWGLVTDDTGRLAVVIVDTTGYLP